MQREHATERAEVKRAGGIIAIVSGVPGLFVCLAAAAFLFSQVENTPAVQGVPKGEMGPFVLLATAASLLLLVSLAIVVLGAIAISARSRVPAVLLIVCALLEAVLLELVGLALGGGLSISWLPVLTLGGGVLALIGTKQVPAASPPVVPEGM
jgi:hypothetical protein